MNPRAVMTLADGRRLQLELYLDKAPITVSNFIRLCQQGFYDGKIIHRIVRDYIIQSGSSTGSCEGRDEGFTIEGEFAENGHPTGIKHERGVISMARSREPNSASTQFFIVHQTAERLDGKYAAFGKLCDDRSFQVLDELAALPTLSKEEENRPLDPPVIVSIRVTAADLNETECCDRA